MKFSKILAASKKEQQRKNFVESLTESKDIFSYLRYIFYRSRYPISYRIYLRILLLFEIYLLYQKIPGVFFFETSLFLFIVFQLRNFLRNLSGYFRNTIYHYLKVKNDYLANTEIRKSLTISIQIAIIISLTIVAILYPIWGGSERTIVYLVGLIILTVLEAISSQLWAIVYLEHRLARSMLLTLAIRFLPVCYLYFCYHPSLITYLSLMLGMRSLEKLYLIKVAVNSLRRKKYGLNLSIIQCSFWQLLKSSNLFKKYLIFAGSFPSYDLLLGLILYLRDPDYWLTFLSIYLFLGLLNFLTLQPARAENFDIYNAMKKNCYDLACFIWERTSKACSVLALLTCIIILFFTFYLPEDLIVAARFYPVIIYLIFLLIFKTQILAALTVIQSLILEKFFYRRIIIILSIGLSLQCFFMLVLRGNLQLFFLIESLIAFILILVLDPKKYFQYSSSYRYYSNKNQRIKNNLKLAPWIDLAQKLLGNSQYQLWAGELDPRNSNNNALDLVLHDTKILTTRLYARIFLLLIPRKQELPIFFRWLRPLKELDPSEAAKGLANLIKVNSLPLGETSKLVKVQQATDNHKTADLKLEKVTLIDYQILGGAFNLQNKIYKECILNTKRSRLIKLIINFASIYIKPNHYEFYSYKNLDTVTTQQIRYLCIIRSFENLFKQLLSKEQLKLDLKSIVIKRLWWTKISRELKK